MGKRSLLHHGGRLGRLLGSVGFGRDCRRFTLGQLLAIKVANYFCHVGARLVVRRHAAILFHPPGPGI